MGRRTKRSRKKPSKRFYVFVGIILLTIIGTFIIKNAKINLGQDAPAFADESNNTSYIDDDNVFTVVIDPGHGGDDSGTIGINGELEKDINLNVALELGKLLEKKENIKVVYTRTEDKALDPSSQKADLQARCDISNNAGADIFVSIHSNFDKVSKNTRGIETWCMVPGARGDVLAKAIQKELADLGYSKDRGIKYSSDGELYVIKNTDAVAVLVELGFLSNESDTRFLASKDGQKKMANAIAKGILSYKDKLH
ncbi:hypothetical protein CDQ84_01135 [Clostridium thermosuccinogenes]|uniref:MurNAc-LAA domain-containing protein n=1 Tax=Clostridium thermosuccinogenes TaxID=84032 RepID=A0A2K2FR88_9CLOT|nr:N-acetylmuramoyl-L-alanine amidase [Pseudoclostridium thermosuccinogenes]AUS95784.1 hypothetical protein CDO33_04600 [Pseudoclostridium thermosuccinogenes]PNT99855.1 hypothetical protein CDQ85_01135 [Pseudoclostridium thermosuccinogenes]PNU01301.1 hypothetical protein CDQ84_01135 [Pseudoclostridium thermosuccinogenes]